MGRISEIFYDVFESFLDSVDRGLDHLQDSVDATLGDPEEEGIKRGYAKAANEFEPLVRDIEREYNDVIENVNRSDRSFGEQTKYLLNKIKLLEEEKERLSELRNARAMQYGISISNLESFVTNPYCDIGKMFVDSRITKMKKAEQNAYNEACSKFAKKIAEMKIRLRDCKRKTDEDLKSKISHIEDCMEEIVNLQKQIAAVSVLG